MSSNCNQDIIHLSSPFCFTLATAAAAARFTCRESVGGASAAVGKRTGGGGADTGGGAGTGG